MKHNFLFLLLLFSFNYLKADDSKLTISSPSNGERFTPGQTIQVRWNFVCPDKYNVKISYSVINGSEIVPVSKEGSYDITEDEGIDWIVPCNIVVPSSISITVSNRDRPIFCRSWSDAVSVTIFDDDLNPAPISSQSPYVRCKGDITEKICIDEQRVNAKILSIDKFIAEDRYIDWYGVDPSKYDLSNLTPAAIAGMVTSGSFGPPIASGKAKICINTYEQADYTSFVVTATKVFPGCDKSASKPTVPGTVLVLEAPDIGSAIRFQNTPFYLLNDNNIPCPEELDCYIAGSYKNLPTFDLGKTIIIPPLPNIKIEQISGVWRDQNDKEVKHVGPYQRVCYDDLEQYVNKKGLYTYFMEVSGKMSGKPFKCNQKSGRLTIEQSPDALDSKVIALIEFYKEIGKTLTDQMKAILGIEPDAGECEIIRILFREGLGPILAYAPAISGNTNTNNLDLTQTGTRKWVIALPKEKLSRQDVAKRKVLDQLVEYSWSFDSTRIDVSTAKNFERTKIYLKKGKELTDEDTVSLYVRALKSSKSVPVLLKTFKITETKKK